MAALTQDIVHPGAWGCLPAPKTSPPPELSPKRHKTPRLCLFNQTPQGYFQELHLPPKPPPFGDTLLQRPPSGTSPGPSTSQHPPSRWLGSQRWGQDPQTLQGRIRSVRGTYT